MTIALNLNYKAHVINVLLFTSLLLNITMNVLKDNQTPKQIKPKT